jgi:hypothetical protein
MLFDNLGSAAPSIIELCHAEWQAEECHNDAELISLQRRYYAGEQDTILTEAQQNYLGVNDVQDNFAKDIVDIPTERMAVGSWTAKDEDTLKEANQINETNQNTGFDEAQLYINAFRDGHGYVLVQHVETTPTTSTKGNQSGVRWILLEKAFLAEDGQVYGVRFHRNEAGDIKFASRRWINEDIEVGSTLSRQMLTLYYPERIEHYTMANSKGKMSNGTWVEFTGINNEFDFPIPWVNTVGEPLGVPIFEFTTPGGSRITNGIMFAQNAINKNLADILGSSQFHGFPVMTITGIDKDEADKIKVGPNRVLSVQYENATINRLAPSNIDQLMDTGNYLKISAARQGRIPTHLIRLYGLVPPSGESLKTQERGMLAFVNKSIKAFAHSWNGIMAMSLALARTFGGKTATIELDATATPNWSKTYTATIQELDQEAEALRKSGVPNEVILVKVWGFSVEDAKKFTENQQESEQEPESTEVIG